MVDRPGGEMAMTEDAVLRRRVTVLSELSELALGFGDPGEFFIQAASRVAATTGADLCLILTSRTTLTSPFTILAVSGGGPEADPFETAGEIDALAEWLVSVERPRVTPTPQGADQQLAMLMDEHGLGSAMIAPVSTSRQARLVMAVFAVRTGAFTATDADFVMSAARVAMLRRRLGRSEAQVQEQAILRASVQALEDRDERSENAQRIAHLGYWDRDYHSGELHWSDETYRIFGLEPQAVEEPSAIFYESLHPDDRERVLAELQASIDENAPYRTRHRIVRADGSVRVVDEIADVFRDEQGKPLRILGTVHDVTERVSADQIIRESAEQINAILEAVPDAIIVADDNDRILRANASSRAVFGWEPEDLVGHSITELVGGEEHAAHEEYIQHYKETGEASTAEGLVIGRAREATGRRADGSDFPAELAVSEATMGEGNRAFVAAIRDISERRESETELRLLNAALEARSEERQALVQRMLTVQEEERRTISYEIHDGPVQEIAAARMFLEAHLVTAGIEEPAESSYLARAIEQLDSGLRGTRRIMAGLRPSLLDDLGLAEALPQLLRELTADSGVQTEVDSTGLSGELSPATEITLFRVAQEASGNAVRHSGTSRITVRLSSDGTEVCLEVEDWGGGFDPSAVSGPTAGEHFGLAGMRERAELLGGSFAVLSTVGEGTVIRASIPLDQ